MMPFAFKLGEKVPKNAMARQNNFKRTSERLLCSLISFNLGTIMYRFSLGYKFCEKQYISKIATRTYRTEQRSTKPPHVIEKKISYLVVPDRIRWEAYGTKDKAVF